MGNVRPFWRAIERERLGTGHSLRLRRHRLAVRRLGLLTRETAERKRSALSLPKNTPVENPGFLRKMLSSIGRIFNRGKKS